MHQTRGRAELAAVLVARRVGGDHMRLAELQRSTEWLQAGTVELDESYGDVLPRACSGTSSSSTIPRRYR
jgi:hypothetical protein